jgi:RND family efflux transporter MFP subunit
MELAIGKDTRLEAYGNLIRTLLIYPQQTGKILHANPELLDNRLVGIVEQVAWRMETSGSQEAADFLLGLAAQLRQALRGATKDKRLEAYGNLIHVLLTYPQQTTKILQANLVLLDNYFLQILGQVADKMAANGSQAAAAFLRSVAQQIREGVAETGTATEELQKAENFQAIAIKQLNRVKGAKVLPLRKLLWGISVLAVILTVGINSIDRPKTSVAGSQSEPKNGDRVSAARLSVRVVRAKTAPLQEWVFADGFASAVKIKHLTFEVPGTINYLKKISGRDLREGDFVKKGELLAQVDDRRLASDIAIAIAKEADARQQLSTAQANLGQAQAGVRQTQAELAKAKASLVSAQAQLKKAQANEAFAKTEWQRYQELHEQGAISTSELEVKEKNFQDTQADVEAAKAEVEAVGENIRAVQSSIDSAKQNVRAAEAQVTATQSAIAAARAQVSKSQVIREDAQIKAPFDGQIAYLNIQEGDYWTPQRISTQTYQDVVERVPIIVIDPNAFEVSVELPAFEGERVKVGDRAIISLDGQTNSKAAIENASAEGRVFSVSPSVTPGARAVSVKIRINKGTANLRQGAKVVAWIAVQEKPQATVLPFDAFIFRDRQPYIFVVDEKTGIVQERQIQSGIEGISQREVLAGVKPGELVVTDGKNRLVNGTPVEVVEDRRERAEVQEFSSSASVPLASP